jgi:putative heme-binding domain-containing protein
MTEMVIARAALVHNRAYYASPLRGNPDSRIVVAPVKPARQSVRMKAWLIGCMLALQGASGALIQTNVSMLVPGFTVQELPIKLSNINNLRFSPQGELTALGYDGRVHILRDADGDGLEDEVRPFWDKVTLRVPVGMAWTREGLYVSSQGKVSLLKDTDGDGKADTDEIIANGWPPTDVASGGVDASAVTVDGEGNLYFGLLTADYSNPYRVKDGVSRYDLKGKRGTIQKWHRATRQLETIATGIRVPYTLAFNRSGDLFVTDQEGETWCPDGNPLDELNHIIPGRNYGFPPRHEKYLPDLVSEAPVVSFGPQHQSACGLVFNERKPNQKPFGPVAWENDAFVAGESRGKIWRVPLSKSASGYTGRAVTIARINMLTTDVAISPRGDLYVSCHSGEPDWGTGPKGIGKLFKITYTDTRAPQPTNIWLSASNELRIAFDKPLPPDVTNSAGRSRIEFGQYVSAADRLEVLKPPYKVVKQQAAAPRGSLRVTSARVEGRELVLRTDDHTQPLNYAVYVPGLEIDLEYDLTSLGVPRPARQPEPPRETFQVTGGDYERGRSLFFGERLKCGSCHRIRGEGGLAGPDLSNLIHRDRESVLRDIREPNALINPDHVAYNVTLANGDALSGVLKSQTDSGLTLIAGDAREYAYAREAVTAIEPSALSLMPSGLLDGLDEKRTRDLLTFLLHEAPTRSTSEARSFLRRHGVARTNAPAPSEPLTIVLVASKQDHGRGQHDYPAWQGTWNKFLGKAPNVTVTNAWEWPSHQQLSRASVLVFYYWNHNWSAERFAEIDAFLARGGGVAMFHSASISDKEPEKLAERIGLAASPAVKYLHTPFTLKFTDRKDHPITKGFKELELLDEPYWPLFGDPSRVEVLATAEVEGEARPLVWTYNKGPGRVFVSIPGHYTWTLDDPLFRVLAVRAIGWAAASDAGRIESLLAVSDKR